MRSAAAGGVRGWLGGAVPFVSSAGVRAAAAAAGSGQQQQAMRSNRSGRARSRSPPERERSGTGTELSTSRVSLGWEESGDWNAVLRLVSDQARAIKGIVGASGKNISMALIDGLPLRRRAVT